MEERESPLHLLPVGPEEAEEVSKGNKLSYQTQWLLQCDTSHHVHNVWVEALCYLLHHVNL